MQAGVLYRRWWNAESYFYPLPSARQPGGYTCQHHQARNDEDRAEQDHDPLELAGNLERAFRWRFRRDVGKVFLLCSPIHRVDEHIAVAVGIEDLVHWQKWNCRIQPHVPWLRQFSPATASVSGPWILLRDQT